MAEISSNYTLDMVIRDDNAREALADLDKKLFNVGKSAKGAIGQNIAQGMKEAEKAADDAAKAFKSLVKDTSKDFGEVSKQYEKSSKAAILSLERQYAKLRAEQQKGNTEELEAAIKTNREIRLKLKSELESAQTERLKADLYAKNRDIERDTLRLKEMRARRLKDALDVLKKRNNLEGESSKGEKQKKNRLLESLNITKKAPQTLKTSKKLQDEEAKRLKDTLKTNKIKLNNLREELKQRLEVNKSLTVTQRLLNGVSNGYKNAKKYAPAVQAGFKVAKTIGGAGKKIIGSAVSGASTAATNEVERERSAMRLRGYSIEEGKALLGEMHFKTGADFSVIVDAINKVRGTIGNASKEEVQNASLIELKYPGMATAFASSNTGASAESLNKYANRMQAIQSATGATLEQIQNSSALFANMKAGNFGSATVTELQAAYLGLQNSGAFESQDELDAAFKRFVRAQKNSGQNALDFAQSFDWAANVRGQRNKTQAQNTLKNMDWTSIKTAAATNDTGALKQTEAEKMAESMRKLEEQKNQMMTQLIPLALPLVERVAELLKSGTFKTIIEGLADFASLVIPPLLRMINFINDKILKNAAELIKSIKKRFGSDDETEQTNLAGGAVRANGGLAWGPTLIGERSFQPEMVLPLDYSRNARANNIVSNVSQTFNMSGNETTALSLSQAVKTRDFRRATTQSAFISTRGGFA